MADPIRVTGKDGTVVEFEAGTPLETIEQVMRSLYEPRLEPARETAPIARNRELTGTPRFLGSFKSTPEGRASMLEAGGNYVGTDADGNAYVYDFTEGQWVPYDQPGFTMQDIVDFSGDAFAALPVLFAGSNPYTVGAAGAAGEAARQMVGAGIPGEDALTPEERALRIGGAGALAGGGQAVMNVGAKGVKALVDAPKKLTRSRLATEYARQGARQAQRVGQPLTIGQLTGSKPLLMAEGVARRHPASAGMVEAIDQQQTQAAMRYLDNALNAQTPGAEIVGANVEGAFNTAVSIARANRTAAARPYFEAARDSGAQFSPTNAVSALDEIIREFDVPGLGEATQNAVNQLKRIRSNWVETVGDAEMIKTLPVDQLQRLLQAYGAAARGQVPLLKELETAQQRLIADRVFRGLQADLDDAARVSNMAGAAELKMARDAWRRGSENVRSITNTVLGRMVGGKEPGTVAPEAIAKRFATMTPSEIRSSFKVVQDVDPQLANQVKADMLEAVIQQSYRGGKRPSPKAPGRQEETLRPTILTERLRASPLWEVMDRGERYRVGTALKYLERIGFKEGEGSPTAPLIWAKELVDAYGAQLMNPVAVARALGAALTPRAVAKALMTPEGQRALVQVTRKQPKPNRLWPAVRTLIQASGVSQLPSGGLPDERGLSRPEMPMQDPVRQLPQQSTPRGQTGAVP